jgi:hypothetical protein
MNLIINKHSKIGLNKKVQDILYNSFDYFYIKVIISY